MNFSHSRQVVDCGDGVCAVTAFAVAALKLPMLAADLATRSQSGDSADSVAAVQDASRADLIRTRFKEPMRGKKTVEAFHELQTRQKHQGKKMDRFFCHNFPALVCGSWARCASKVGGGGFT